MTDRHKTSVYLSTEALSLLRALAERFGISGSAVLELAIREKAERAGVTSDPSGEVKP